MFRLRLPSVRARGRAATFVAALLLAGLSVAPAYAQTPRNLLVNPGFERAGDDQSWMPAGWDSSDAGLNTVFFGRDTFIVHSGRYSVNVANTSALFPMGHNWSQTLLVGRETWGKDLVLSVWTRSNGVQGRAYILLQAYRDSVSKMSRIWGVDRDDASRRLNIAKIDDPAVDLGWKREYFSDEETGWVKRTVRVYVPYSTNVVFVRCGLAGIGQVLFDDASLTLEPARPAAPVVVGENLLVDAGFEGVPNGWEYVVPPYEGSRADIDSSVAHSGRQSVRCSEASEGLVPFRMGVSQAIMNRNLGGKHVRLSGWVKADSLKGNSYVKVYAHSPTEFAQSGGGQLMSGTFDWTELTVELDIPRGAVLVWPWMMYNVPANGTVWFDDIKLEVTGPSTSERPPAPKPRGAAPAKPASRRSK